MNAGRWKEWERGAVRRYLMCYMNVLNDYRQSGALRPRSELLRKKDKAIISTLLHLHAKTYYLVPTAFLCLIQGLVRSGKKLLK